MASALPSSAGGRWLQAGWWRPQELSTLSLCLHQALTRPLAALLGTLLGGRIGLTLPTATPADDLGVPVLVVGNLVVGGAGKTPTVVALVHALKARGWRPGIISRGYGADAPSRHAVREVDARSLATDVGDEPALMARRCPGTPVFVGRRRREVARALLKRHSDVDVIVSDDGLQHRDLPRQVQLIVFDERGAGNGRLLPAGPLRQALPDALPQRTWVLYNAETATTPLPGPCAQRSLRPPQTWRDWAEQQGQAPCGPAANAAGTQNSTDAPWRPDDLDATWHTWHGRHVTALAGIGHPQRFFDMLSARGLNVQGLALNDHADLRDRPWHRHAGPILMTAKDAIKVRPDDPDLDRLWVVSLDFALPNDLIDELERGLKRHQPDSNP